MLLQHFKISEQPFGVTPDPRFLFASKTHREALSSLLYGVYSNLGFFVLTASPGMGKTTLLFEVLRKMEANRTTVFLFQPISSPSDLYRAILNDLGISAASENLGQLQAQLNQILVEKHAAGKKLLVAIDESQNLSESVLESIRMLSNFETANEKLMQVILSGQPEFSEKLFTPQLLQLRQRISIYARLSPFSQQDTASYIQHRLAVAGCIAPETVFTPESVALIANQSEGIPRNINNICFNSLSLSYALQATVVTKAVVEEVLNDLHLGKASPGNSSPTLTDHSQSTKHSLKAKRGNRKNIYPAKIGSALAACIIALCFFAFGKWNLPARLGKKLATQTNEAGVPVSWRVPIEVSLPTPAPAQKTRRIEIKPGQSLLGICTQTYNHCSPDQLKDIVKENPSISNPDHIEFGKHIVVPIAPTEATDK